MCNYNTATNFVAGCLGSAHNLLFLQSPPEAVSVSPVVQFNSPVQQSSPLNSDSLSCNGMISHYKLLLFFLLSVAGKRIMNVRIATEECVLASAVLSITLWNT